MPVKFKSYFLKLASNKDLNHQFKVLSTLYYQKTYFTTSIKTNTPNVINQETKLDFKNGLVTITVPLAAKHEKCLFTLKPLNDNVGNFIQYLKNEDKGIEIANLYTLDDLRISHNTPIGVLVQQPFKLKLNEISYLFEPPKTIVADKNLGYENDLDGIKTLVSKLYLNLNIQEYERDTEQKIIKQIETIKSELQPLEQKKEVLVQNAKKHTNRMIWFGLGLMSLQAGILARLTWFEYSWDIVEPISYFVTYSAVIGVYAYFVLTRKEYDYESASDRIFLRHFHKNAAKSSLDVDKYNNLKGKLYDLELVLKRIKDSNVKIDNLQDKDEKKITNNA